MLDLIARPFGMLMMWLYSLTHNYLLAIIFFTLIVKLILLPFQMKSKKSMMRMSLLTPQLKELEKKHGANKVKYNEEVQKLYREENINPMSGCVWSLIPFPILIALYQAIRKPITIMMGVSASLLAEGGELLKKLTEFGFEGSAKSAYLQIQQTKFISENWEKFKDLGIENLRQIEYKTLGLDLGATPNWKFWTFDWSDPKVFGPALGLFLIPILAAVLTWLTSEISTKMNSAQTDPNDASAATSKMMTAFMPIMTLWFAFLMPAALGVYWIVNSVFGILQDVILTKAYSKTLFAEAEARKAERQAREAELEAKRAETERLRAMNATTENSNTSKRKQQIKKRQETAQKASEYQRSLSGDAEIDNPSRVGDRKYARGRAYDPNRFARNGVYGAVSDASELDNDIDDDVRESEDAADTVADIVETAEDEKQGE